MKLDLLFKLMRSRRTWTPYVVLVGMLLLSALASYYVAIAAQAKDRLRFENEVQRTQNDIQNRLQTYITLLRTGSGLFAASPNITQKEFRAYVNRLELHRNYPGIQGIGFSLRIMADRKDTVVAQMQKEGVKDFRIRPSFNRFEYHSIIYLEPQDRRNKVAIGYDMFTSPVRRAAMELARDTDQPAVSGKVTLVQEIDLKKQAGFLIYVPVYRQGTIPKTVAQRRAALQGFVYSPFRADDLLKGILNREKFAYIDFQIYDGTKIDPENLLHSSQSYFTSQSQFYRPQFQTVETINISGRPWTIVFTSRPELDRVSEMRLVPYIAVFGGLIGFILFAVIRSQVRARAAAERSQEALRASEERFRRLFDSNLIGVAFWNVEGKITDANDAYLSIVGFSREEFMASGTIDWKNITPPEYQYLDDRAIEETLERKVSNIYEKEYLRRDGIRVPIVLGIALLNDSQYDGVAFVLDITDRKRAQEEREQLLEKAEAARNAAEAANRMKDEFLATLSHELRTPLNAMVGWTNLLRSRKFDESTTARALETIDRNTKSLAQLIEDLLDVSRIMSGKFRIEMRPVNLAITIENAIEAVRSAAEAKNIQINLEIEDRLSLVSGDRTRLQQIVWNLLANAIKFTPKGGQVDIILKRDESNAKIIISDNGQGISSEFLPYIFERFRQADASITRSHGGLGLGLAIVRHLVELHGGSIWAESGGEGQGSTFTVTLPLRAILDYDRISEPFLPKNIEDNLDRDRELQTDPALLHNLSVLVVDDEADARELVSTVLEESGAKVTAVGSAKEAFEIIVGNSETPDILVSDIGMPGEDGYTLIHKIRKLPPAKGGNIPALALTAYARAEEKERAIAAGFQIHVAKPVVPKDLVEMVANLAGKGE